MPESKVRWYATARKEYFKALEHNMNDSVQSAEKMRARLLEKLETIAKNQTMCPPDKYKANNDGTFRAFTLSRYRVSYRIKNSEIRVLRMRHSSMKPKYF